MAPPPVEPDFQWTFADIPDEPVVSPPATPEAEKPGDSAPSAAPTLARPRRRWRLTRRAALTIGLGLTLLAGGVGLFVQLGWRNLYQQVAAVIAYEDQQSAAGAVEPVRAVQVSGQPVWSDRRAAEAALKLVAAQPGANLLPVAGSAQLQHLTETAPGVFVATVQRRYRDSSGQVYMFNLTQRYRNQARGVWLRLPPDEAALTATSVWRPSTGSTPRLVVTYPSAERATLMRILPLVEGYAERACADWLCPPELSVPLVVSGRLSDLPAPGYAPRTSGPLPIAFDLAQQPVTNGDARRVVVAAPALVGEPADAEAEAALARAWGASVLAYLANELAGSGRHAVDDYLDALTAREELRLGLSPAPDLALDPLDYVPVEQLWPVSNAWPLAEPALARRRQALVLLNAVLLDSADGDARLLRTLRTRANLRGWLADRLDADAALAAWHAGLAERLNAGSLIAPAALDGVAYTCGSGAWLYRGGLAQPLGTASTASALDPHSLSPDGRYLATITPVLSEQQIEQQLTLYDRANGTLSWVAQHSQIRLAGWAANGDLFFYAQPTALASELALMRAPARADFQLAPQRVFDWATDPLWSALPPHWSADHTQLGVTVLLDAALAGEPQVAVVAADTGELLILPELGFAPAVTPDGQAVAYVAQRSRLDGRGDLGGTLALAALATPADPQDLVYAADLHTAGRAPQSFQLLDWSPDGQTLSFIGVNGVASYLYVLDRATRQVTYLAGRDADQLLLPVGFSGDSRYMAYFENSGLSNVLWLVTRELSTGTETRYPGAFSQLRQLLDGPEQVLTSGGAAWAPDGDRLVVSSDSGVLVFDPESGAARWLTFEACGPALWYDLPG